MYTIQCVDDKIFVCETREEKKASSIKLETVTRNSFTWLMPNLPFSQNAISIVDSVNYYHASAIAYQTGLTNNLIHLLLSSTEIL